MLMMVFFGSLNPRNDWVECYLCCGFQHLESIKRALTKDFQLMLMMLAPAFH